MKINDLIIVIILVFSLVLGMRLNWNDKANNAREFTFVYSVDLKSSNGKKIELWIPVPQSNEVQRISNLIINVVKWNRWGLSYLFRKNQSGSQFVKFGFGRAQEIAVCEIL